MLLPTVSLDLMKHATDTHFMHGSHGALPLLKICCLTFHLCHFSDPDDQSRLDMEVLKFRKQAYATSTKTTYKSQLRAYLTLSSQKINLPLGDQLKLIGILKA